MANDIVLETRGLVKKFGDAVILNGIDFTLHDKEVAVILGPSGCGKSTFLRCLIGLEPIQGGNILLKGKPLEFGSTLRSGIGMVFQSYDLFPHLTVLENILLAPLHVAKRSREDALAQAETLLERVKLWDKRDFYPRQLSGGQKQRAAIVRALSMNPSVMLFDEVTASRLHTKLNERFGSANAVHINREACNQHDVEAKARQASLHQVCEGFSQIKSKEVRRLCVGHRHGSVQGCADKHHETSKQQDNRRVIILEDAVRNPCDHKKGNEDSEHSGRSPVVVAVCFFWLSADQLRGRSADLGFRARLH